MKRASQLLSKTKYIIGLQCPRLVWVEVHEPGRIPETDPVTQYIFDQGHLVGELAKKLFPDGTDISTEDFMGNINMTKELLKERKPLFEAGILAGNLYSRVDILPPTGEGEWDIVEVKSSTSVKDVHINDVAFQRYCCNQSGLNIRKCYLALINNHYVRDGEIDPKGLFNIHDVTVQVEEASVGIQDRIDGILEVVGQETCPEMIIGPHCRDPYECPLTDCWDSLPENNVFTLYYGGKKSFEMYNNGIVTIDEIPDDYKLSDKQRIQQACVSSGEPYIDREAIYGFLSSLEYPLHYLDFETISPAVPLFDGVRPYQNIPFQFSLHVVRDEFSQPEHFSFLASGADDPRPAFITNLKKVIGETGSIVVYNAGFETAVLTELTKTLSISGVEYKDWRGVLTVNTQPVSQHSEWLEGIVERIVDLLTPFRNFYYYHPLQKGSNSLKAVLPAITGRGYEDLDISDGQIASLSFLSATFGDMPRTERAQVMANLEEYCGRDTEGMLWIVKKLRELI
ncbi:hypothetical protein ES707_12994 [subsurface metagenome]